MKAATRACNGDDVLASAECSAADLCVEAGVGAMLTSSLDTSVSPDDLRYAIDAETRRVELRVLNRR